jgi:hypothetical protein
MSLLELQRRNLIVKFCLETPNKSKSETDEHFKLLGFKILLSHNKKVWEARKFGSGKKCTLSSFKVRAALKEQTAGRSAKSYRELGRKIQVHLNTVKKYLTKMESTAKPNNPHLKPQHVNNPSSKLG